MITGGLHLPYHDLQVNISSGDGELSATRQNLRLQARKRF